MSSDSNNDSGREAGEEAVSIIGAIQSGIAEAISTVDKGIGKAFGLVLSVLAAIPGIVNAQNALDVAREAVGFIGSVVGSGVGGTLGAAGGTAVAGPAGTVPGAAVGGAAGSKAGEEAAKATFDRAYDHAKEVYDFNRAFPVNPLDNNEISDYFDPDISRMYSDEYTSILGARADLNQPNSGPNSGTSSDSDGDSSESESSNSNSNADPYGLGGYEHGVGDNDPGDGDESGGEDPIGWDGNAEGYDKPGDLDGGSPDGGGGDDPGGSDPGSGFGGKPIVLDLDNDGLELVALEEPTVFFDLDGDGYRERAAWVSADDGLLADDKDGDGELDPGDADWSKFRVWQDLNRDGESDPGELRTLTEAGITSIPLTGDGVERRAIAA